MIKQKKDRRLALSSVRLLSITLAVSLLATSLIYSMAWGDNQKLLETQYSDPVFSRIQTETFDGKTFTSEELKGTKLTLFNVWETTCPPCLGEMPSLEKLSQSYDKEIFQIIGICADLYDKNGELNPKTLEKAKSLMQDAGTTFPHLIPEQEMKGYIDAAVEAYPTSFLVDRDGNLITITTGAKSLVDWQKYIAEQLEELK